MKVFIRNISFSAEFSTVPSNENEKLPLVLHLPNLTVNEKTSTVFYMHSHCTGERNVTLRLSYVFAKDELVESVKIVVVNVPVTKPLDVTSKYFSNKFDCLSNFFIKEPFYLMPQIRCSSPWRIVIEKTAIELVSIIKLFIRHKVVLIM